MKKFSVILALVSLFFMSMQVQAQPFQNQEVRGQKGLGMNEKFMSPPSEEVKEARRNLRVTILKEELALSQAQTDKVDAILKSFQEKARQDYEATKSDRKERRERAWVRKQEKDLALLDVLNEDQKKQFAIMKGERKFKHMARCGGKRGPGAPMKGGF
jgi:hypothetical protein